MIDIGRSIKQIIRKKVGKVEFMLEEEFEGKGRASTENFQVTSMRRRNPKRLNRARRNETKEGAVTTS